MWQPNMNNVFIPKVKQEKVVRLFWVSSSTLYGTTFWSKIKITYTKSIQPLTATQHKMSIKLR